jgi:hypothetical protein
MAEYKVGDVVRIKSKEWYEQQKDNSGDIPFKFNSQNNNLYFLRPMSEYCGKKMTISEVLNNGLYHLAEDNGYFCWIDRFFDEYVKEMEYKKGQKVRIKSIEWFANQPKDIDGDVVAYVGEEDDHEVYFTKKMSVYCGQVMTIQQEAEDGGYYLKEDMLDFIWSPAFFDLADDTNYERYKVGDVVKVKSEEWFDLLPHNNEGDVEFEDDGIQYKFPEKMYDYCGQIMKINGVKSGVYTLDGVDEDYLWSDKFFDSVGDKIKVCVKVAKKYSPGDKVTIKDWDWFSRQTKDECGGFIKERGGLKFYFTKDMAQYCGREMTIQEETYYTDGNYRLKEDDLNYDWAPDFFEGGVEDIIVYPQFKIGDKVKIHDKEWFNEMSKGKLSGLGDVVVPTRIGYACFTQEMKEYCDQVMTIKAIDCNGDYFMEEDSQYFIWSDEFFDLVDEDEEIFDEVDDIEVDCDTNSAVDKPEFEVKEEVKPKHKIGDVVRVKSKEWYDKSAKTEIGDIAIDQPSGHIWFCKKMTQYCGQELTITSVTEQGNYFTKEANDYLWCDEFFEDDENPLFWKTTGLNIAKILNGTPKGTKLYSPCFGYVRFGSIRKVNYGMTISIFTNPNMELSSRLLLNEDGTLQGYEDNECILFPSHTERDWSKYVCPKWRAYDGEFYYVDADGIVRSEQDYGDEDYDVKPRVERLYNSGNYFKTEEEAKSSKFYRMFNNEN